MFDTKGMDEKKDFHLEIISQIWGKIAGEIYSQYKQRGRGIVVMFMMDDLPDELKAVLPPGATPTGKGAAGAYIPRDCLLPLENLVGEQGILRMDHILGQYDPDKTIVFTFIEKTENEEGKTGIKSAGYEITPPPGSELSPRELWKKRKDKIAFAAYRPRNRDDKNNPIINLN
jgi:hypothetical protein